MATRTFTLDELEELEISWENELKREIYEVMLPVKKWRSVA